MTLTPTTRKSGARPRRCAIGLFLGLLATAPLAAEKIPVTGDGGVYSVPVQVNGALTVDFVLDTGASVVMIPADVALALKRTGTLEPSHERGVTEYELADGSTVTHRRVVLRTLTIGSRTLRNVEGVIGSVRSTLLLGQTALRQLEPWRLDTKSGHLIVMQPGGVDGADTATPAPSETNAPSQVASMKGRDAPVRAQHAGERALECDTRPGEVTRPSEGEARH
jgi:clan AA aspartic protease (TIGR02281 family)